MAAVTQSNSMEHSSIETMIVTELINKVSAFCGKITGSWNFGREDVSLTELAWIRRT
jgi:hypothetical protein